MIFHGIKKLWTGIIHSGYFRWDTKAKHPTGDENSDGEFSWDANQSYGSRPLREMINASQDIRETATNRPVSYNVDVDMSETSVCWAEFSKSIKTVRWWRYGTSNLGELVKILQRICFTADGRVKYSNRQQEYWLEVISKESKEGWSVAISTKLMRSGDKSEHQEVWEMHQQVCLWMRLYDVYRWCVTGLNLSVCISFAIYKSLFDQYLSVLDWRANVRGLWSKNTYFFFSHKGLMFPVSLLSTRG